MNSTPLTWNRLQLVQLWSDARKFLRQTAVNLVVIVLRTVIVAAQLRSNFDTLLNVKSGFFKSDRHTDVVMVGAPCADHTRLNDRRDTNSCRPRLIVDAAKLFIKGKKIGVFETVENVATINEGRLFQEFCVRLLHQNSRSYRLSLTLVIMGGVKHASVGTLCWCEVTYYVHVVVSQS